MKHNVDLIFTYVCAFEVPEERKASKRDVVWSKTNLLKDASNHRLNSADGEVWFENHIKIDNTNLLQDDVADMVIEKYKLVANENEEKEYRFGV